jgi:hypothetical protein
MLKVVNEKKMDSKIIIASEKSPPIDELINVYKWNGVTTITVNTTEVLIKLEC